jgi:hypothetical protein
MFKLQLSKHDVTHRLSSETRDEVEKVAERLNGLPEDNNLFDFTLYSADGDKGVFVISGVVVNFKHDQSKNHIHRDNRFIIDCLHLEGSAMDLDGMDESLAEFVRLWHEGRSVSYENLIGYFKGLDDRTVVILSTEADEPDRDLKAPDLERV